MKRTLALLLAALMLFALLAGCGQSNTDTPAEPTDTTETPAETPVTSDAPNATETETPDAETPAATAGEISLPLVDELTTLRVWRSWSSLNTQAGLNDQNDARGYQVAEELTNVHVDWELSNDAATQFPLLLASGTYPDLFQGSSYATGAPQKLDNYADEEIILDLTDYITELAPYYMAARTADEDIARRTTTDDHRLLAFFNIKDTVQPSWLGYVTRTDWLGDRAPKTYDEYHDLLVSYRDDNNCPMPTGLGSTGVDSFWMAGFDVGSSWIVLDGKVEHSVTQPGYKEYLTLMNQWYNEGLIDPDFYSRTMGISFEYDLITTGQVGLFCTSYTWIRLTEAMSGDPNFKLTGIEPPVKQSGDVRKIMISSDYHRLEGGYAAIFATCSNPELAVRYLDFFFTEQGSRLVDFGVEGESYTLDENGEPQFMDCITNPPEGMTSSVAWLAYTADGMPHLYVWERELKTGLPENAVEATHIWDNNWVDSISFPSVSLTAQESEDYSSIMNDIETRISETVVKFIIGSEPMENFDSFVDTLVGMGLNDARDIEQAAYDRFMAR